MKIEQLEIAALAMLALFAVPLADAQPSTVAPLTFSAASVKIAAPGGGIRGGCHGIDGSVEPGPDEAPPPLGRCVITNARLGHLIRIAYGVSGQDLGSTGPDWTDQVRFDVNATADDPANTTQQQLLTMLQNLLVERFHMKFHYQNGEAQGFTLTVAKGGPKLQVSRSKEVKTLFTGPQGETIGKPTGRATSLTAEKWTMPMLVDLLSGVEQAGHGVDKTGLTGEYDFKLSWDDENGPALSTALHDLGLQMKIEKVPTSCSSWIPRKNPPRTEEHLG